MSPDLLGDRFLARSTQDEDPGVMGSGQLVGNLSVALGYPSLGRTVRRPGMNSHQRLAGRRAMSPQERGRAFSHRPGKVQARVRLTGLDIEMAKEIKIVVGLVPPEGPVRWWGGLGQ